MPSVNPPKFDGLNSITTANNVIRMSVGGAAYTTQTVAVGDYFAHVHTAGGDTDQLQQVVENAVIAGGGMAVFAFSDTTGRVTITNNGAGTLEINWTFNAASTALRDLLGFTGAGTGVIAAGGGTLTAANQHYNGWYPNVPPSELFGAPSLVGVRISDAAVTIAPSGRVVTTKFFEQTLQRFEFSQLSDSVCFPIDSTVVSYEQFWQRVLSAGVRFRYYPDREDRDGPTGAGPFTYVADQSAASEGTRALDRTVGFWSALYDLRLPVRLFVA